MGLVLRGLAWLGTLLISFVPWIFEFFAKWMTRKVAVTAALIAAFVALTGVFYAAIYGIIAGLTSVAPPYFEQALGLFMPSNAYPCLAAVMATYVARWVYDLQLRVLSYTNPGAGY